MLQSFNHHYGAGISWCHCLLIPEKRWRHCYGGEKHGTEATNIQEANKDAPAAADSKK